MTHQVPPFSQTHVLNNFPKEKLGVSLVLGLSEAVKGLTNQLATFSDWMPRNRATLKSTCRDGVLAVNKKEGEKRVGSWPGLLDASWAPLVLPVPQGLVSVPWVENRACMLSTMIWHDNCLAQEPGAAYPWTDIIPYALTYLPGRWAMCCSRIAWE